MDIKLIVLQLLAGLPYVSCDVDVCKNDIVAADNGTFTSPNFGNSSYLPNTKCTWLISAPVGEKVRLQFNSFGLEKSTRCHNDHVRIYDGSNTFAHMLGNFCGLVLPGVVISTGNVMLVVFRTNNITENIGFNISYSSYMEIVPTEAYKDDGCHGDVKFFYDSKGSLSTPGYDGHTSYDDNRNCSWVIQAPRGYVIKLKIEDFKTEVDPDCQYDYMSVYDGGDSTSRKLVTLCGIKFPADVYSTRNQLFIKFISDADVSLAGINMTYEFQRDTGSSHCNLFRCGDNSCVLQEMVCNNITECPDGSDELLCVKDQTTCGRPYFLPAATSTKIVGGREVIPHSWPWMVSLQVNGSHTCGGAIIDPNWVISAAHCFEANRHAMEWTAVAGKHFKSKPEVIEQTRHVERIIGNSLYNYLTTINDIAVVKVTDPFIFNEAIAAVCLPVKEAEPGEDGIVTGWGEIQGTCCPDVLKQVNLPIISREVCSQADHLGDQITKDMFCAGYEIGGQDACQGDSGGPFVMKGKDNVWRIAGITSFGSLCAAPKSPGVYTDVFKYLTWIREQIANN